MPITTTYNYHDEAGNILYQVCRMEPKGFFQRRPDSQKPGEWINGLPADIRTKSIYHLPEILNASPDTTIYIVEGEKDADNLKKLGILATSSSGGAGKWPHECDHYFQGRDVAIIADNDEPGMKHADDVSRGLHGKAKTIKVLCMPEGSKDASDFIERGATAVDFQTLYEREPLYTLPDDAEEIFSKPSTNKLSKAKATTPTDADNDLLNKIVVATSAKAKGTPNQYMGQCPAHADSKASLSIGVGEKGKILLHCFAGCEYNAIVKGLGIEPSDAQANPQDLPKPDLPDFQITADHLDKLPIYIRQLATHYATTTSGVIDSKHIMLAIATWAAIIGKRAKFANWGVDYYPNLCIAILAASGQAKSNLKALAGKMLAAAEIDTADYTTATAEGIISHYSVTIPSTKDVAERMAKKNAAIQETGTRAGVAILTDELLALTGGLIRKDESAKYARLLCKLLDNDQISMVTKKDGVSVWAKQCVNIIGMSQIDSFNDALRASSFKEAGLSGRIIPINSRMLNWAMTACPGNAAAKITRFARLNATFNIHFGNGDALGDAIAFMDNLAKQFIPTMYDPDWLQIRSKILIYGAKIATVFTVLDWLRQQGKTHDEWSTDEVTLDASNWVRVGMLLVHTCHASNFYYIGVIGEQHDRIKQIIERKGQPTKRDLCKFTGWDSWKVEQIVRDLIESGEIRRRPTGKTTRYSLCDGKTP